MEHCEKLQKQVISSRDQYNKSVHQQQNTQSSQFSQEYFKYFEFQRLTLKNEEVNSQDIRERFKKDNIIYDSSIFVEPSCHIVPFQFHPRVAFAHVSLGFFKLTLQILYEDQTMSQNSEKAKGNFGMVFDLKVFDEVFVVKQVKIRIGERKNKTLCNVIKQYCCLKIASALGCGPRIHNYLGFDLIVFENCIQFAMEKTLSLSNIDSNVQKELKEALYRLHMVHFIHFDIKCQNIAYSPHFKKAVFQDFGLSEFVKQGTGMKSFINYRGSLAFCGEEMINIFYDTEKHYIDVYYNDASCLKNTMMRFSQQQNRHIKQFACQGEQINMARNQQIQKEYYVVTFAKYLLCNMKFQSFNFLFRSSLSYYIKDVLKFMQQMSPNPRLNAYFSEGLKQFKFMDEYVQLLCRFAKKSRIFTTLTHQQKQLKNHHEKEYFYIISIDYSEQKYSVFQDQQILNCPNSLLEQRLQIYFSLYLKATRFDSNSVSASLQSKLELAIIFAKHVLKEQLKYVNSLQTFKKNFIFIMKYALSPPLNDWKKQNVYFILLQTIILDCNFQEFYQDFKSKIQTFFTKTQQLIIHLTQIQKVQKLLLLKHASKYPLSLKLMNQYFLHLFNTTLKKIRSDQTSQLGLIMHNILNIILKSSFEKQDYLVLQKKYNKELMKISQSTLRKKIQKFIYSYELYLRIGDVNSCFSYLQHMNPYFQTNIFMGNQKTICFDLGLYEYVVITKSIDNTSQLERIGELMRNCFGFDQIYSQFKFQMLAFLSKEQTQSTNRLIEYANQIIECPLIITHESISAEFLLIWKRLTSYRDIAINYPALIQKYISKLTIFLQKVRLHEVQLPNMINESHMFQLAVTFSENKTNYIQRILSQLKKAQQSCENEHARRINTIKYLVYSGNLYLSINELQKSYKSFLQLLQLGLKSEQKPLLKFCYLHLYMTTNKTQDCQKLLIFHYQVCHQMNEFKPYFIKKLNLAYFTLKYLHQANDRQIIYQFLQELSAFVTLYPTKAHFDLWIKAVSQFIKNYRLYFSYQILQIKYKDKITWENIYLICYYALLLVDEEKEINLSILWKIASNLKGIKYFAQQFSLCHYYQQIFKLAKFKKRKSLMILQRLSNRFSINHIGGNLRKQIKKRLSIKSLSNIHLKKLKQCCRKISIF